MEHDGDFCVNELATTKMPRCFISFVHVVACFNSYTFSQEASMQ